MYIGPKSRAERPRKTKIGTQVAHVTRVSDPIFKVKRSKALGRFTHSGLNGSGSCSSEHGNILGMGILLRCGVLGGARRFGPTDGGEGLGKYRGGRPPAFSLLDCEVLRCGLMLPTCVLMVFRVVEFASYSEMKRAIDKLDNTELSGRRVRLIEDKTTSRRRRRLTLL